MKLKKSSIIALVAALCVALFASTAMAVDVATKDDLNAALKNGGDINITQDIPDGGLFQVTQDTNINLNGYTITRAYTGTSTGATPVFYVTNGKLTLTNGSIISTNSAGGTAEGVRVQTTSTEANASAELNDINIQSDSIALSIYGDVSVGTADSKPTYNVSATINGNSTLYGPSVGAFLIGKQATLTLNNGEIKSDDFAISGNGTNDAKENCGGTVIEINGGTVISQNTCAIYQPQAGTITVTGGTITGTDGIQMKSGTLVMSGGTLEGTGAFDDSYTYAEGQHDGSIATGAALAMLSEGSTEASGYAGNITVTISDNAVLKSTNGYAVAEAYSNFKDNSMIKFNSLTINGGTFSGGKGAVVMTNAQDTASGDRGYTSITAGTFNTDLTSCPGLSTLTNLPATATDSSGNYYVVVNATGIAFKTSELEMSVGDTATLEVVYTPDNTTETALEWTSSNTAVATVDKTTGEITAVAAGTTEITAALASDTSITAKCTVTVTEAEKPVLPDGGGDTTQQPSTSGGGGGCSAGFGALALLAVIPLALRKREK